jgi:hypothetical protein
VQLLTFEHLWTYPKNSATSKFDNLVGASPAFHALIPCTLSLRGPGLLKNDELDASVVMWLLFLKPPKVTECLNVCKVDDDGL